MRRVAMTMVACVCACLLQTAAPLDAQQTALPDVLEAAARYVDRYTREFFGVVATERYEQTVRADTRTMIAGPRQRRRTFDAEVAILSLDGSWVGFRDIVRVDGKQLADRTDRLMKMLTAAGPDLARQGRALADEGSRFNLGSVVRTLNHPALAFIFLAADRQARSRFTVERTARVDGFPTTVVAFTEQARPGSVYGGPDKNVQASGRFWIEEGRGRIVRTELHLEAGQTFAKLVARYGTAPGFEVLVPLTLDEQFETPPAERIEGLARYSGFRRFSVDTQEKRGGGKTAPF